MAEQERQTAPDAPELHVNRSVFKSMTIADERESAAGRHASVQRGHPDMRRRAVSFSGATSSSGARPKEPRNRDGTTGNDEKQNGTSAKPQREDRKKNGNSVAKRGGSRERANPIKDWIHSAGREERATATPPTRRPVEPEATKSPSWADYDEEANTQSPYTTSPEVRISSDEGSSSSAAEEPETPPAAKEDPFDSIYAIPPSGQVNEQRARRLEKELSAETGNDKAGRGVNKSRGKMVTSGVNGNNSVNTKSKGNSKPNESSGQPKTGNKNGGGKSFTKVVTRSGWKTVPTKKRKYNNVSPKGAFPLKGAAAVRVREVYLQGLEVGNSDGEEDIIDSVRAYCIERGITPVYLRIIPVRYDYTITGCKLTIKECDYMRCIEDDFWPYLVRVRDWTPRPRDNNGNDGGAGYHASDDEN